ncbi:hypothetical protein AB6887_12485 [Carnobacterium divergens]|nr:hypothetical protein [Carnobacterium divergens]SBO17372.1 hypothetical protein CDIV41_280048 [Carnobacterium divergens]
MEKFKMKEINMHAQKEDFELLEDSLTPSWGIACKGGSFGIWCN